MYEAEVNNSVESIETLPVDVTRRFSEFRERIAARTTLPWGEHCTECVWPTCYTTCELYTPRTDGACRQFVDGMVRIDHKEGLSPYLLKLRFKGWAKLWTVGNLDLQPLPKANTRERVNIAVGAISRAAPLPAPIKLRLLRKVNYLRRQSAEQAPVTELPDYFLLECYNPNARAIALTLTIRAANNGSGQFQEMVTISPGYTRAQIKLADISRRVDLRQLFEVELVPNDSDDTVLYFGLMDFVKERLAAEKTTPVAPSQKWKCIVWDLDNTLWDGVLIEDGLEKIRVRQEVVELIKSMDQRGILHSIASKNDHQDGMNALRAAGLDDYFLYPQIAWRPKSESIARIAKLLNIGIDTIAFVDDQVFEREEVKTALPEVTVIDAADCAGIPDLPACQVPVTAESAVRRVMYREQEQREAELESYNGDYAAFLRSCQLELDIRPLDDSNLKRVYELAQRTNQLNFSGRRYSEVQLAEIRTSPSLDTHVISCSDRFGTYGIVGFAVVDRSDARLLDLMFSCRIQSKRVEHAVLAFLLKPFIDGGKDFHANYRRTTKNAPSGKVFDELGFEYVSETDGVTSLVFPNSRGILDERIVTIQALGI